MNTNCIQLALDGNMAAQEEATIMIRHHVGQRVHITSLEALTEPSDMGLRRAKPGFLWAIKLAFTLLPVPLSLLDELRPAYDHRYQYTEETIDVFHTAQQHILEEVLGPLYWSGRIDGQVLCTWVSRALDHRELVASVDVFVASCWHRAKSPFREWLYRVSEIVFLRSETHSSCIIANVADLGSAPTSK